MKKFSREIVVIDKIVGGGQAMGLLPDGRKVFVWGALPGESVEVQITKSKKSYAEAITTKIIKPSAQRINPVDQRAYMSTSPWQIMTFGIEQQLKSQLVKEAFALSHIDIESIPEPLTDGQPLHYRNKMEYSLWWDKKTDQISLAFHIRGTHQKTPVAKSSIEKPEILAEAKRIIDDLNSKKDSARKYQSLLIRSDQKGKVSSALFENRQPHPEMSPLEDSLLGHKYSYSPNGFFQINVPVYEMALTEIKKHISTEKVIDMYSGVGTIGLSVARDRDLTLLETDNNAFQEMLKNVPPNSENIRPVHSKSEDALEYITSDATIILDPPRAGLDKSVVERLIETLPPKIIYLSCDPATQARDVKPLLDKYKIETLQPFNFFPRTPHIENLVVLSLI